MLNNMRCNFDDVEICQATCNDRRNVVIYSLGNFVCAKNKTSLKKIALIVTLCKMDFICIDYSFLERKKTFTSYIFLLVSTNQNKRFNLHVTLLKICIILEENKGLNCTT